MSVSRIADNKLTLTPDLTEFMLRKFDQFYKLDKGDLKKPKEKMYQDTLERFPLMPRIELADPRTGTMATGDVSYVAKNLSPISSEFWDRLTKIYRERNIISRRDAKTFGKLYHDRQIRDAEAKDRVRIYSEAMTELFFATMIAIKHRQRENHAMAKAEFKAEIHKNWDLAVAEFEHRFHKYREYSAETKEENYQKVKFQRAYIDEQIERDLKDQYEATVPNFVEDKAEATIMATIETKLAHYRGEAKSKKAEAHEQWDRSIQFSKESFNSRLAVSRELDGTAKDRFLSTVDVNAEIRQEKFVQWKEEHRDLTAPNFKEDIKQEEIKELIFWKGNVFNMIQAVAAAAIAGTYFPVRSTTSMAHEYMSKHVRNHRLPRIGGVVNIIT